jgi:hypothetical protein
MTLALHYLLQAGLAALGGAGIVLLVGKFLLNNLVQKRVDLYYAQKLAESNAMHAEDLATLTADLKAESDSRLAAESAAYEKQLAAFTADLQRHANEEIENIRSRYVIELETKRAQLNLEVQDTLEFFKLRRETYTPLVELIYRVRNKARDARDGQNPAQSLPELNALIQQVMENVYQSRSYLEHDRVHLRVHSFKNTSQSFSKKLEAYSTLTRTNDETAAAEALAELQKTYLRLDEEHTQTIASLQALMSAHPHPEATNPTQPKP